MGIDEFRDLIFKPVYTGESDTDVLEAALPLHDGTVLFKTNGKLFALRDAHSRTVPNPPGETVTSMFEDREDRLWSGFDDADEVLVQGRDRIDDLRSDTAATDELSETLTRYGNQLAQTGALSFSMNVTGAEDKLDPILREEIYRIGREALGNAFKHSKGSGVEAEIIYDLAAIKMRIRDDGAGIDPEVPLHGRPGHWGLSGMRERAEKIGARLSIWSRPTGGSELELVLPIHRSGERQSWWLRRKWRKRTSNKGESK